MRFTTFQLESMNTTIDAPVNTLYQAEINSWNNRKFTYS